MDTNTFSDVTWIPCLGRNLNLGDLYDCCTDEKAIGSGIWDEKAIHEAKIECPGKCDPIECTDFVLHNNNEKTSCLGISGELYLSCAAGHIKLCAEAGLFNDNVVSKNVLRVALKCYSSSKTIQLNKSKLSSWNINTFEQEGATHVITGMLYGAISIIVCDQKIQGKHDTKATYESLKTKLNYLQRCVSGNCPEMYMESSSENITCKVFSTINITHKIETYADAVRFCEDLYKLHAENSAHVPISISLFPLKKINKAFTKNVRNINDIDLIDKIKSMHDTVTDIGLHLMDLQANIGSTLACITEQIESYNKTILDLRSEFTKIVGHIVPKYRRSELEKPVLKEKIEATFDKLQKLSTLVQSKLKEVQQIYVFMKAIKDYDLISAASDVYYKYRYIICLEFNSSHLIDCTLPANALPWYQDKKIIAEVRYKIKQFLKFAKENSINEGIKFALSEFSDKKCSEIVMIRLYYDKEILQFEPPTPPSKPIESQKTESSITVIWSKPEYGAQFITSYHIYFSKANDNKWTTSPTIKFTNNTATIERLEVNTGYLFKVSATMKIGTTIESQVSEVIYTAKLSETKTSRKNAVSKSIKPRDTFPDNLGNASKIKTNTAHSTYKGASATPTQTQGTKASENKTVPQEKEIHSQNATSKVPGKGNVKVPAIQKTMKNIEPKGSTIKRFHEANECKQLTAGSLCMYKLIITHPRVNMKFTDVELHSFGRRDNKLTEKVILLVGATGAGKSTLINGMVNYIFGVDWEDPERLVLIESSTKKGATQAVSQTKSVNVYKINHSKHDQLSYNFTIIDTPGFEDADGLSKDETIMTKIKSLLTSEKVIDHIDAIGFVVQAPLSRLTPTQSYIINSVYSLFGNDIANNIFVLATFSDPVSPPHVQSALDEAKILFNKMFKFNNSALYVSASRQDDKHSLNKLLWKMGMESFSTFFRELEVIDPVSLTLTKDVLNERKKLQIILEGLKTQINREFLNMQKLEQEETMLTKHKNEAEINENFHYQEFMVYNELVPLQSKFQMATNCDKCERTCHSNCFESHQKKRCMLMMSSLYVFGGYICCLCKCPMEQHKLSNSVYHLYTGTETVTIKSKKQKYDKATAAQMNVENIIEKITTNLKNVRKATRENLSEMHRCIQQINEISLQPNLTTEADYISTLIASENAEQTKGYTTRLNFYQKILKELQNADNDSDHEE